MAQKESSTTTDPFLDPMHSMGYLTRVNFRMFSKVLEHLTLPHGVSAGQWRLLRILWEQDNITQRELSDLAGTTEATTVHAVRSLISADLAKRTRSTADKRKIFITLTPRARKLRATLMPIVVQVNDMALDGIDPEHIAITRQVLTQTYANLCAHAEGAND